MERKLTKVVDGTEITETGKMCSCGTDVANHLCSWECTDTCGNMCPLSENKRKRSLSLEAQLARYAQEAESKTKDDWMRATAEKDRRL